MSATTQDNFYPCEPGQNEILNIDRCPVCLSSFEVISFREELDTMTKQFATLTDVCFTDTKFHFLGHYIIIC